MKPKRTTILEWGIFDKNTGEYCGHYPTRATARLRAGRVFRVAQVRVTVTPVK